jgi:hypothetical protein
LLRRQGEPPLPDPREVAGLHVFHHVLERIEDFDFDGIERAGFEQGHSAVRAGEQDPGMVDSGAACGPVAHACPALAVGGEENVARLRDIGRRRAV